MQKPVFCVIQENTIKTKGFGTYYGKEIHRRESGVKKRKPIVLSEVKPEERKKYEIAEELGLLDRVLAEGWQSLSAKETGKIGGMLSGKAKKCAKKEGI